MNPVAPKSLKQQYSAILFGVVVVDATILGLLTLWPILDVTPSFSMAVAFRVVLATVAPMVVLLLNPVLPSRFKAVLVYWRLNDVLPGHRAFSKHAMTDVRIDLDKLKKNIGIFPSEPRAQNAKWYGLYKKVEGDPSVQHVHQQFLMLRDVATLSLLLLCITGIAFALAFIDSALALRAGCLFAIQYLLSTLGARSQGVGFVTTVLALHSIKRRV